MFRGAAGGPHRPSRIRRGDERRKHVKITEEDAEHARTVRCSLGATADTVGVLWPQLLRLPFSGQESNFDRLSHFILQSLDLNSFSVMFFSEDYNILQLLVK